jgi:hypothetical protein
VLTTLKAGFGGSALVVEPAASASPGVVGDGAWVAPGTGTPSKKVLNHLYFVSVEQPASNSPPDTIITNTHNAENRWPVKFL